MSGQSTALCVDSSLGRMPMLRHVILPLMTQSRLSLRLKTNHGGLIADMNQQLKCGNATLFWLPVVAPLNPARRAGERVFFVHDRFAIAQHGRFALGQCPRVLP
jgi:hypothetical protein